eukprot:TRINITY_DN93_c2_g1_i2.p6 TRINITY_DN93_c2_g1~~TRINITY_DN93_c2_g1_i2.p6  ORF type:complete len:139 (+),score=5.70 TRINITY_DN93_c2_g1_i2:2227-2643(+)
MQGAQDDDDDVVLEYKYVSGEAYLDSTIAVDVAGMVYGQRQVTCARELSPCPKIAGKLVERPRSLYLPLILSQSLIEIVLADLGMAQIGGGLYTKSMPSTVQIGDTIQSLNNPSINILYLSTAAEISRIASQELVKLP